MIQPNFLFHSIILDGFLKKDSFEDATDTVNTHPIETDHPLSEPSFEALPTIVEELRYYGPNEDISKFVIGQDMTSQSELPEKCWLAKLSDLFDKAEQKKDGESLSLFYEIYKMLAKTATTR